MTARAALATLEIMESENLAENARRVGGMALERLREIAEHCSLVRIVRRIGLLLAIDLCGDGVAGRTNGQIAKPIAFRLARTRRRRILFAGRGHQYVCPLVITEPEMTSALDGLERASEDERRATAT